jgi:lipoprotein-releasing system ATP-binding protein
MKISFQQVRFQQVRRGEAMPQTATIDATVGIARPVLRAEGLGKRYVTGSRVLELFRDLNFSLRPGEMAAIVGASGSGKSTLLHLLGALDRPTAGEVYFEGKALGGLSGREAAEFRNREAGYVWQFHYLLPEFTALENVALPLLARGESKGQALGAAREWLKEVGLEDRAGHRSGELSGGEQQRVALARALVTGPKLLLADEPTGDLDAGTADGVFSLIRRLHTSHGLTSILVTHNQDLAWRCDRVLRLKEGRLEEVSPAGA